MSGCSLLILLLVLGAAAFAGLAFWHGYRLGEEDGRKTQAAGYGDPKPDED